MPLSCLLAAVMAMNSSPAMALWLQDTQNGAAQGTAPAHPETPQTDTSTTETPAEANKARAPDETTKTGTQQTNPDDAKKNPATDQRRRKHGRHNAETKAPDNGEPHKVVVRHGGASEPTARIVPNLSREEAIKLRQNSEGLLGSAEVSLRVLGARTLQPPQQETVTQIRDYMERARSALKEGDIVRAHTLALKASLLADDLVKR